MKRRRFKFLYLLLLERKGRTIVKIGVTNNPNVRLGYIRENVSDIQLIRLVKTNRAAFWERHLHEKYSSSRFTFRGAGAGKTEYFRFNWLEMALVLYDFFYIRFFPAVKVLEWIFVFGIIIAFLKKYAL